MSLNECIRKSGVSSDDASEIKRIALEYIEDGKSREEAGRLAAKELLGQLYGEWRTLQQEVEAQGGVLPKRTEIEPEEAKQEAKQETADPEVEFSLMSAFQRLNPKEKLSKFDPMYVFVDDWIDQKRAQKEAGFLSPDFDPYLLEQLFHGRTGERLINYDKNQVGEIVKLVSESRLPMEDVGRYLVARHAKEANRYLKEINPNKPKNDALSGMGDVEAGSILRVLGKNKALVKLGTLIDKLSDEHLDTLVDYGLIKPEEAFAMRARYEHFVPLNKEDAIDPILSSGGGMAIRGKEKKLRIGGESPIEYDKVLAYYIGHHYTAFTRGERDRVMQAFYRFVVFYNNPDYATVDKLEDVAMLASKLVPELDAAGNVKVDAKGNVVMVKGKEARVVPSELMTLNRDNVVPLKIGGEQHWITFNPENEQAVRMARVLKNIEGKSAHAAERIMSSLMRGLAALYTSFSVSFGVSNFLIDLQGGMVNLNSTELKDLKWRVFKGTFPALRDLKRNIRNGDKTSPGGALAERYRLAGGTTTWADAMMSVDDLKLRLDREMERFAKTGQRRSPLRRLTAWVEDYNKVVENGIRMSAFKAALDMGLDEDTAGGIAKNLTVNFNKKGAAGPWMKMMYLFSNPAIQGNARAIETVVKSPKARALLVGMVIFGMLREFLNRAMSDDDEDGKNIYDSIPDTEKDRYFILMGGDKPWIKFPMIRGFNVFDVIGQVIARSLSDPTYDKMEGVYRVGLAASQAFVPIYSATFLQFVMPTLVDPLAQISENVDWAGRPVAPEQSAYGVEIPNYQRYFTSARELSKYLAETLNDIDGDAVDAGFVNVSPEWLDIFIDMWTGTAGRDIADTVNVMVKAATGEEITQADLPVWRRFAGRENKIGLQQRYYDNMDKVARIDLRLKKDRKSEEYKVGEASPLRNLIPAWKASASIVRRLREVSENVRDGTLPEKVKDERIAEIDAELRREMARFNKLVATEEGVKIEESRGRVIHP